MKIWHWVPDALRNWFSKQETNPEQNRSLEAEQEKSRVDSQSELAQASLRELLQDPTVPEEVRNALSGEYAELGKLLQKLEQEEIHIAVFGRVSVGKSSLLNALMGENYFSVSPLHGETKQKEQHKWKDLQKPVDQIVEHQTGGVHFIDTPGIDEVEGEGREVIARKAAMRADIILFVIDGDLTQIEFQALQSLKQYSQPLLLILNKSDHFTEDEQVRLMQHLRERTKKSGRF